MRRDQADRVTGAGYPNERRTALMKEHGARRATWTGSEGAGS